MNELLPRFDALYVISDIHMGGRRDASRNFQIFRRGQRLAAVIRSFAAPQAASPGRQVCLAINGDLIDTLAEDELSGRYVSLDNATSLRIIEHLFTDDSFAPVWEGLSDFVRTGGCHLVIILGNHDLELALSVVQRSIVNRLAGDDNAAAGRIHFETSGAGFSCNVGGARVFCTHGNEVDEWNLVDYTQLGGLANALNSGRAVDKKKWEPNAGTRLVVDVMNKVKREHPFVDLLKPESSPVFGVLLTIDSSLVREIDWGAALPIAKDRVQGEFVKRRILSAGDDISAAGAEAVANETILQLLGPKLGETLRGGGGIDDHSEDDLLLEAGAALGSGEGRVSSSVSPGGDVRTLGWWDIIKAKVGLQSPEESLRMALSDWLEGDATFSVKNPKDSLYTQMVDRVSENVQFVVTGHTHLAQALELNNGGFYFNAGTWVRLLRMTPEMLEKDTFTEKVYPALQARSMDALDTTTIDAAGGQTDLILDRTNFVQIVSEGDSVTGTLMRAGGVDDGSELTIAKQPRTDPGVVGV